MTQTEAWQREIYFGMTANLLVSKQNVSDAHAITFVVQINVAIIYMYTYYEHGHIQNKYSFILSLYISYLYLQIPLRREITVLDDSTLRG